MKKKLVYVCSPKLVGIDSILPLLYECYNRNSNIEVLILFYDDKNRILIENNPLFNNIISANFKTMTIRDNNSVLTLWNILKLYISLISKRNFIFKEKNWLPKHKLFIKFIKFFSNTSEILFSTRNASYALLKYFTFEKEFQFDRGRVRKQEDSMNFDYCMSNLSIPELESVYSIKVKKDQFLNVGYPKTYPCWNRLIDSTNTIKIDEPYIVLFLTRLDKRSEFFNEPPIKELLFETLKVVKEFQKSVKIVIKPHPITDMDVVQELLSRLEIKNYIVLHEHHKVLSKNAQLVILNHFSTLIPDVNFLKIPVVLYHSPDQRLKDNEYYQKLYSECIDYDIEGNTQELFNILTKVLDKNQHLNKKDSYLNMLGIDDLLNLIERDSKC